MLVIGQYGMRNHRRRGVIMVVVDVDLHAICGKDLDGRIQGWLRQGMRVHAHEERPRNALVFTILKDGLANG